MKLIMIIITITDTDIFVKNILQGTYCILTSVDMLVLKRRIFSALISQIKAIFSFHSLTGLITAKLFVINFMMQLYFLLIHNFNMKPIRISLDVPPKCRKESFSRPQHLKVKNLQSSIEKNNHTEMLQIINFWRKIIEVICCLFQQQLVFSVIFNSSLSKKKLL